MVNVETHKEILSSDRLRSIVRRPARVRGRSAGRRGRFSCGHCHVERADGDACDYRSGAARDANARPATANADARGNRAAQSAYINIASRYADNGKRAAHNRRDSESPTHHRAADQRAVAIRIG